MTLVVGAVRFWTRRLRVFAKLSVILEYFTKPGITTVEDLGKINMAFPVGSDNVSEEGCRKTWAHAIEAEKYNDTSICQIEAGE